MIDLDKVRSEVEKGLQNEQERLGYSPDFADTLIQSFAFVD